MAKQLTNNGSSSNITIGLDIGYGVTKAITDDQQIVFPSVMGYSRAIKFRANEIASKYSGDQLFDDEGHWFVGDLAMSQLQAGEQRRLPRG
jgi:hypothetical protein